MRGGRGREDTDPASFELIVLPDGRVVLPKDARLATVAEALGDLGVAKSCRQASMNEVMVGKGMCG